MAVDASEAWGAAIRRYGTQEQVSSATEFSDLRATDWAYQALSNLLERYGCVAGYPNGMFAGSRPISRFEAAALLNGCLDRVSERSDALRRLLQVFEKELATLKGRSDGLEARLGVLEASQFSSTIKLGGQATFVVGSNAFGGSATALRDTNRASFGATTFNCDLQLFFDTSFTGKDLLRTTLRAGNFDGTTNSFGGGGPSNLSQLEVAFQEDAGANVLGIDRLYYQFPVGKGFTVTAGGRVGQEDMLALWPSVYPNDTVFDVLTLNGAPAAYNKNLGPGAGIWWQSEDGFSISANYVAANGSSGNPATGGVATAGSGGTGTVQLGYAREQWAMAAIWSYLQNWNDSVAYYSTSFAANQFAQPGTSNAFALSGYWQPKDAGWIPSISAGWGLNRANYSAGEDAGTLRISQSWSVGLQWLDALAKGNAAGFAVGQPIFVTSLNGDITPNDGNYVWEWWYQFLVSDSLSVTPALLYLSRPLGQDTPANQSLNQLGGLVKTTFRF